MQEPADRELILAAQEGNVAAFEKLIEKQVGRVMALAFSYTHDIDDAKDIYQETLIRAFRSIRQFAFRSEFSTWVYRIAINVCLSFTSSRQRERALFARPAANEADAPDRQHRGNPSSGESVEGDFIRRELTKRIEGALTLLSPMQRLVFTMKHYEGYKLKEIALVAQCSEGTVKKHLFVAVRRLQQELKGADE